MVCLRCAVRSVNCFEVCGCAVSRRNINVGNCDMFIVVNMYLHHFKYYVVCISDRRYACCSECYVVSNGCDETSPCLMWPIGAHDSEVMYFGSFFFRGELAFLNCDYIGMCVVNWQFEFVFNSVYVVPK